MGVITNFIGGLAGAVALNILHETAKRLDHDAPRMDLVGEEALNKGLKSVGAEPLKGDSLFAAALAGDLLSNALYYSSIGIGGSKYVLVRGAVYGLSAGIGAVELTKPLGLSDAPITKTNKTKVLTVAWYLFGGMVAAITIKALSKK
jgi:hypothetical protein